MGREDQGVHRSRWRYQVIPRVLCFITHGDEVLLVRRGLHKRLWPGLYNGVGGHVEAGEDIQTAILREVKEETGLQVSEPRLRGVIHVDVDDPVLGVLVFVFTAVAPGKELLSSDEGTPEWVGTRDLPGKASEMVEDLPTLLPAVLTMSADEPPFFAVYSYDANDRLVITFADLQ